MIILTTNNKYNIFVYFHNLLMALSFLRAKIRPIRPFSSQVWRSVLHKDPDPVVQLIVDQVGSGSYPAIFVAIEQNILSNK